MKRFGLTVADIKQFLNQFEVTLVWDSHLYAFGTANSFTRTIRINRKRFQKASDASKLSLIFHELCHILCYDHKKYICYHDASRHNTLEERKIVRQTGLKAERFCEKMAEKFMHSIFPDLPYHATYFKPWVRKWYHDNYLNVWYKV